MSTEEEQQQPQTETKEEIATPSPLEQKIIRQIEYYFGDVNLPRDKFLKEKIKEDDEWVTIECLTTFSRLKQLSTDFDTIKDALKKSTNDLLEIHDTEYKVRRSKDRPLPDQDDPLIRKSSKDKTLYMKGFPVEYNMDEVQDFFDQQDVKTVFIKLRRDNDKQFKGSIFVELSTIEEAKKLTDNKELKCGETTLTALLRDDYFKNKTEERREADKARKDNHDSKTSSAKIEMKPGCILHLKGFGENTKREDLKELFGAHEQVAWVDFKMGDTEAFMRFQEENGATKALEAVKAAHDEGKVIVNEVESTPRVLEGEEEENYWKTLQEDLQKRTAFRGGRGRNNNFGRRGGRGGNKYQGKRGRPWEDHKKNEKSDSGHSEEKKSKVENEA